MLGKITSLPILALLLSQGVISNSAKAPPYEDQEAYEVYSAILPSEWPLRVAHAKRLIIQNETKSYEMCLRPENEWQEKIGPAISDYVRLNAKPLLLQPKINVEVPYQLINADELRSVNSNSGWEGFYQRYSDSGGWMELLAVGFNGNKTVAVVYMGHHCGPLCGGGGFHVLERKMENGLPSTGRDQAAHGRPEQAHTDLRRAFVPIPRLTRACSGLAMSGLLC